MMDKVKRHRISRNSLLKGIGIAVLIVIILGVIHYYEMVSRNCGAPPVERFQQFIVDEKLQYLIVDDANSIRSGGISIYQIGPPGNKTLSLVDRLNSTTIAGFFNADPYLVFNERKSAFYAIGLLPSMIEYDLKERKVNLINISPVAEKDLFLSNTMTIDDAAEVIYYGRSEGIGFFYLSNGSFENITGPEKTTKDGYWLSNGHFCRPYLTGWFFSNESSKTKIFLYDVDNRSFILFGTPFDRLSSVDKVISSPDCNLYLKVRRHMPDDPVWTKKEVWEFRPSLNIFRYLYEGYDTEIVFDGELMFRGTMENHFFITNLSSGITLRIETEWHRTEHLAIDRTMKALYMRGTQGMVRYFYTTGEVEELKVDDS